MAQEPEEDGPARRGFSARRLKGLRAVQQDPAAEPPAPSSGDEPAPGPLGSWMPPDLPETDDPQSPPVSEGQDDLPEAEGSSAPAPEQDQAAETPAPRGSEAALAYCRVLLSATGEGEAESAATDAVAAFEQALAAQAAAPDAPLPPQEDLLLAVTRLMAAVSLPDTSTPAGRRAAVRASIGDGSHCTCRESAALLAAQRNGTIDERGALALASHLAECPGCRELTQRLDQAEIAFRDALATTSPVSPEADPPR